MKPGLGRSVGSRGRSPAHSLAARLFLWLLAVMVPALAVYAWVNIETTSTQWRQAINRGAYRTSDLIRRSLQHEMLLNRKDDVHAMMRMIAEGPGVVGIRIYDKSGTIIFSAQEEEIGRRVDLQAEACVVCHGQAVPLQSVPSEERTRVYRGRSGERILGLIHPIENLPECSNASCHAHPADQTVLGVLDVQMSMAYADERLAVTIQRMAGATVALLLLMGAISAVFIQRVVRSPLKLLAAGTDRVARGELDTRITVERDDEIGALADAFNRMAEDLGHARAELTGWSRRLEEKVVEKTETLGRMQREVVHIEKMASLGKLAATVAHELNNPLAGVLTYARLVERNLEDGTLRPEERDETMRYLQFIRKETARCGEIVRNLLLFARPAGASLALHPLNPILERSLMLVRHHLEMANVTLQTRPLEGDDAIVCDADQIQQALVALFVNAVQAMPSGGTLTVALSGVEDAVRIEVRDTGIGIPAAAIPHIFEPFFSTKEEAHALGLGLSVVYGIVQRHGGRIEVESIEGKGTALQIWLPRKAAAAPDGGATGGPS
jgi:two-component system NtrC family sensor kinase